MTHKKLPRQAPIGVIGPAANYAGDRVKLLAYRLLDPAKSEPKHEVED
jgi:hypothetical protein